MAVSLMSHLTRNQEGTVKLHNTDFVYSCPQWSGSWFLIASLVVSLGFVGKTTARYRKAFKKNSVSCT